MTLPESLEIWAAHNAAVQAVLEYRSATPGPDRMEVLRRYRSAERRFYRAWQVAEREALAHDAADPVAASLDSEQEAVGRG